MTVSSYTHPRRHAPEKAEQRAVARLLCDVLGFTRWSLSQSRATKQSPGWPDDFYTHPEKRLAVWYEAKAPNGKQSEHQKEFERHVTMGGYDYVVGTHEAMTAWAVAKGLVKETAGGALEVGRGSR